MGERILWESWASTMWVYKDLGVGGWRVGAAMGMSSMDLHSIPGRGALAAA